MNSNRGMSKVGLLIVILLGAGAVVAAVYFSSDVWRTKIDTAYADFSKWTPENIAKDPAGYLNFCEAQVKKSIDKLKASEIAIGQKKAKLEAMRDDAKKVIANGERGLDELKTAYRKADTDKAFPLSWQTAKLDQDAAKRQIMKLANEIKSRTDLLGKYESAISQLTVQANKVLEAKDRAKEQLAKIDTNREMIKVQQITDSLKDSLVAMRGAIENAVVGVVASDNTGSISLDDVSARKETVVDDKEFDKVMGK